MIINRSILLQGPERELTNAGSVYSFNKNCQMCNLSSHEKEKAELICQGLKYRAIAGSLYIAERTVTKHAQNICEKVEVSNKVELCNKLEYSGSSA